MSGVRPTVGLRLSRLFLTLARGAFFSNLNRARGEYSTWIPRGHHATRPACISVVGIRRTDVLVYHVSRRIRVVLFDCICLRASRPDVIVIDEQRRDVVRWRHLHHVSVDASRGRQVVVYFRLFKGFPCRRQRPLSSKTFISSYHFSLLQSPCEKCQFIIYLCSSLFTINGSTEQKKATCSLTKSQTCNNNRNDWRLRDKSTIQ